MNHKGLQFVARRPPPPQSPLDRTPGWHKMANYLNAPFGTPPFYSTAELDRIWEAIGPATRQSWEDMP